MTECGTSTSTTAQRCITVEGLISRVTKTFQYRGLVVEFCTFVQTSGTEKQTSYRRILCRAKNPNFNFLRHVLLWSGPISLVKYFTFVPDELKFGPFSDFLTHYHGISCVQPAAACKKSHFCISKPFRSTPCS